MKTAKTELNPLTQPLRVLAITALVALSAGALQTAQAAPGEHAGHGMDSAYGGGHGGGHGGRGMDGRGMERMLDSVDATAEQRAQIKQIVGNARQTARAQHQQAQTLRQQSAALFAQPNVDARAAEALRQQMLAQHDQASKVRMQMMLDISRVLTPQQRQKMADNMSKRRAMMERHRSERESLEANRPR